MATYKVIQDVEAEDKLLGPLTLRQFVYAGITGICIYLSYFVASKGAAVLIPIFIPPALISAFFAFPWSKEQPTELWALARIRFIFKPRKRIWDQSGVKELVTINVPKRAEQVYTDGLSQTEVRSRLQALATTIDSRGWAIKNPAGSQFMAPAFAATADSSDRLIAADHLQQPAETEAYTDVLDPANSKVAAQFDSMLSASAQTHHDSVVASLQQPDPSPSSLPQVQNTGAQDQPAPDYWFLNENPATPDPHKKGMSTFDSQVVVPGTDIDPVPPVDVSAEEERNLVEKLRDKQQSPAAEYSHLPTILPLSEQEKLAKQQAAQAPPATSDSTADDASDNTAADDSAQQDDQSQSTTMTDQPDAAILELARNDDLNVETLARQAKRAHGDDEVVISLH